MAGLLDFNNCKIISSGVSSNTNGTLRSNGWNEAAVKYTPNGCTGLPKVSTTAVNMCFTSSSGLSLWCNSDTGAPVYCNAPSNNEWIMVGVAQVQSSCGTSPEFRVIQHPG
ncbi:unnamed protein product [Lymnaea stagnalis]|uniref:Uncharacterized protein n=1 Tax=Lymnaea stagnalis TaxID=6523 RepID=A0AAV2HKJ1_LYMST